MSKVTEESVYEILEQYFDENGDSRERIDENGDAYEISSEVGGFLNKNGITHKISIDEMFDNSGCNISSISIAWVGNGEVNLIVERIFCC